VNAGRIGEQWRSAQQRYETQFRRGAK